MANPSILPRQGEVSPKVTEGEDTEPTWLLTSPSVWQGPATSPWRGGSFCSGGLADACRFEHPLGAEIHFDSLGGEQA
jgi:hypothetical protein